MNRRILVLSGLLLILLTSFYISFLLQAVPELLNHPSEQKSRPLNKTLGFERIYVINLAHRIDRRLKMEAIRDALDLDFEFFPAVSNNDFDILEKYDFNIAPNHKTCYVSHYRAYESMIRNGYSSVLILEDDIDFEMEISSIMAGIFPILPADWDMLYVGHCSWDKGGKFIGNALGFDLFQSQGPACTHAYAVSLAGAEKLIKELVRASMPVDLEVADRIKSGHITAYTLEPSAIVQWKSKDNPSDVSPGAKQWTYPLTNSTLHSLGYKET